MNDEIFSHQHKCIVSYMRSYIKSFLVIIGNFFYKLCVRFFLQRYSRDAISRRMADMNNGSV